MPWYYAGPQSKPVGPISVDELHARRRNGLVLPETYIIEWNEEVGAVGSWRLYSEVFSAVPPQPPLPPPVFPSAIPAVPSPAPHGAPPPVPAAAPHAFYPPSPIPPQPHPLFPSAGHPSLPVAPAAYTLGPGPHGHYPHRKTNAWCGWGFGLGIASFVLSFLCVGSLIAVPALIVSILGFAQVQRHREQSGRGLAAAGGILSLMAIVIGIALAVWLIPMIKAHEGSVTEQSSTNSE